MMDTMQFIVEGVHTRITTEMRHPSVRSVEWSCSYCQDFGKGFMPEPHASGSCEGARASVPPPGYVDGGGI